jgi:hypothetical protein
VRDPSITASATHVIVAFTAADGPARETALALAADSGLIVMSLPDADDVLEVPRAASGSGD